VKPTIALPAGMAYASLRSRRTAMFIDLGILLVLFLVSQFLVVSMEKSQHRTVYDRVSQLNGSGTGSISKAHSATSDANKKVSTDTTNYNNLVKSKGANSPDAQAALATKNTDAKAATAAKNAEDALNKELSKDESVLAPLSNLISGIYFLVSLLLLIAAASAAHDRKRGCRDQGDVVGPQNRDLHLSG